MYKAVLSTTVLPLDGAYTVRTLKKEEVANLKLEGVPHYIGHPDTKAIVESMGAVPAPTKLFDGLQPGESAVCFPIQQGKSTRALNGFTSPHQDVSLLDLSIRVITRVDGVDPIDVGVKALRALGYTVDTWGAHYNSLRIRVSKNNKVLHDEFIGS